MIIALLDSFPAQKLGDQLLLVSSISTEQKIIILIKIKIKVSHDFSETTTAEVKLATHKFQL
jgi:hypothetical protein